MELSVKINAAIDGFVSAMKAAKDSVAGVTNAAAKPIVLNTDTSSLESAKTKVSELRSELGKLTQAGQGGSPAAAEIRAQIKSAEAEVRKLTDSLKQVDNASKGSSGSGLLSGLGAGLGVAAIGLAQGAISGLISSINEFTELSKIQEQAEAKVTAAIKSTGGAAGITAQEVFSMASSLQNVTTFGDEATLQAQSMLLTFTNIGKDVFPEATETMLNMATAMGTDAKSSAIQLGKALNDPTEGAAALRRVGVALTEQQLEQIKTFQESGDIVSAQKIILKELGTEFGGLARSMAQTDSGKLQQMANRFGDIKEVVGKVITQFELMFAPIIDKIFTALEAGAAILKNVFSVVTDNSGTVTAVLEYIGVAAAAVGAALLVTLLPSLVASTVGFVSMGIAAASAWVAAAAPVIALVAAIAAVGASVYYLYDSFEGFRNVVNSVWDITKAVFEGLVQYAKDYWEILKSVGEIVITVLILPFKLLWAVLSPVISAIGDFISGFFKLSDSGKQAGGVIDYIKKAFEVLHNVMGFVTASLKAVIAGISTFAETATKVIDKVMHLDFSGAVDAAKEGGKKIGDSTAGAFNESMKEIKSKEAAKKFEEDFKAAAAAVQAAIVSIDTSKLGESFETAKKKAADTATGTIAQLSGVQVAFDKLQKAQAEDLPERMLALEAFNRESGAQNVTSYEQAKALVKQSQADLKKSQAENLDASRKMKAIENSNSIEFANKERQINEQTALKKKTDSIEQNRQAQEKIARDTLQSEMDLNIQLLQIQGEADAAKFDAQIASAKKLLALKLDLTPAQKKAELQSIADIQTAKDKAETDNLLKIQAERAKFAVKDYEEAQKAIAERLKLESEFSKKNVELTEKRTVETTQQELDKQADLINAKLDLVQAGYNQELNDLLAKNKQVIEAESALKNALAKGNDENTARAKEALENARQNAIANDALVLELRKKSSEELQKVQKDAANSLAAFRISLIEDDAERERETRLSEIQKTFTAELLAAAGNERLILDAHRKANAARYDSDEEYNRKTTDLATRTAGILQGLGMDIATGISEMYGNTFNDLGKAFDDYAAGVQKKMEGTGKEDAAKLEEETKTLRAQLAKREISYQDFQEKIAALRGKEDGGAASATERANLAIGKSFAALGKSATAGVDASIEEMKKLSKGTAQAIKEKGLSDKNVAKDFEKFGKDIVNIGEGTAESVIGVFGQMAAAGTLTLKSAANAALGITIDTISKIVLAQAPAILAIFTGTIPPPFGFIAGIAAIGAVQLLLATAKGAIGADQGVIGIDGNYSTPRSSRDTIPIWVRDGESIINPEATAQNRALLKFINSTNRPASEFFSKSVVTGNGTLQLAHSNQIRTAQLVASGSGSGGGDMTAMQNSLSNIERSLATAKIIETKSKHTSAVQLSVTENRGFRIQQEKAALKLERARK